MAELLLSLGVAGVWKDDGDVKRFYADSGAVLSWWPSTGTVLLQGDSKAKVAMGAKLSRARLGREAHEATERYIQI